MHLHLRLRGDQQQQWP